MEKFKLPTIKTSLSTIRKYQFRILAVVLFLILLLFTWKLFYTQTKYPEELHITLQEQLKSLLMEKLQKSTAIENIQFQQIWTEATKKGQIRAHFRYSYQKKDADQVIISGHALLEKQHLKSSEKYDLWLVTSIEIDNEKLFIDEPITLFGNRKEEDTADDIEEEEEKEESSSTEEGNTEKETALEEDSAEQLEEVTEDMEEKIQEKVKEIEDAEDTRGEVDEEDLTEQSESNTQPKKEE